MRILSVFAFVLALGAGAVFAEERAREIFVTGEGIASAPPDMATIRIGVAREARLAGDALGMTSDAMTAVLALLENAGIAAPDIQTTNVGLNPRYQRTERRPAAPRGRLYRLERLDGSSAQFGGTWWRTGRGGVRRGKCNERDLLRGR